MTPLKRKFTEEQERKNHKNQKTQRNHTPIYRGKALTGALNAPPEQDAPYILWEFPTRFEPTGASPPHIQLSTFNIYSIFPNWKSTKFQLGKRGAL